MCTLVQKFRILCEYEGSTNWHHEVLIRALHYNCALALPCPFFYAVCNLAAPHSICIVYKMVNTMLSSKQTQLLYAVG